MPQEILNPKKRFYSKAGVVLFTVALTILISYGGSFAASEQKAFASPQEAVKALVTAAEQSNRDELLAIFGPGAEDLLFSGDPVADEQRRVKFVEAYKNKNSLVAEGDRMILVVGEGDFPFPIPLVRDGDAWIFDTAAGREEILNRRIGENELNTMKVCLAIADAQREYAMKDRDGDGILEYAQQFISDPGKKNGLYWEVQDGEELSPLGILVAKAKSEGYGKKKTDNKPTPYHGYYYKILKAQGPNAPGGAYDYVVDGNMIGGFAVLAYPATYGNTGVMTFMVNHDGILYEKNLGPDTAEVAAAITEYDPDDTWREVKVEE